MSILATSPTSTRHFDMNIASALGDINAAIIVQQLHYWMEKKEVGVIIEGVKYIYNTFVDWVNSQFKWLSVWQFRKAMSLLRSLGIVKVVRYKAKQWNQTNYYTLDSDRLGEFLLSQTSKSIEMVEMWVNTPQGENNQHLEMRDSELSLYEPKITTRKVTAKTSDPASFQDGRAAGATPSPPLDGFVPSGLLTRSNHAERASSQSAAAPRKIALKEEEIPKRIKSSADKLTACNGQNKPFSEQINQQVNQDKTSSRVDYIVNKKWQKQVENLDSAGIPVNQTVINLLKMYSPEQVDSALALFLARKREQHIPNPSGYFVAALKGDWAGKQILAHSESAKELDTASVFRYWYDLARELGYCSGQEVRQAEQWVCLSGSWEKWEDAMARGYSLEYLKKVLKRNQGK